MMDEEMYQLIDTHAHLDEIENLEQVLAQAKAAGLSAIVAVGSDIASNQKTLDIAGKYPGFVYPALGWHPWYIKEAEIPANLAYINANIDRAVAIGEVGLDYHKRVRAVADKELQKRALTELLKIAKEHDKPALIHSRYAWRDAFDMVKETGLKKAVFHWYTGTSSVLRDIIDAGYYISVTPAVAYHEEHRRAVKETPLARLLLETDCPVVYARGREGEFKSNPADVIRSLKGAATLKGLSEAEIAEKTTENARRLFRLEK
ncbi:MAG: TatD family hydrolase [Dehalococcoidales bacterium]